MRQYFAGECFGNEIQLGANGVTIVVCATRCRYASQHGGKYTYALRGNLYYHGFYVLEIVSSTIYLYHRIGRYFRILLAFGMVVYLLGL